MDTTASDIIFDENGNCNFCNDFLERKKKLHLNKKNSLNTLLNLIKKNKKKSNYDCLIGISGGIDSCWALKKAVDVGLKPLAVHFDNGWNTNLSQENIYNLLKKLNVDLITYVVDWDEYVDVQRSFFKSNVVDIELIYDNALLRVNYETANKFNIKYILAGTNNNTEGMRMPKGWNWFKYDKRNIKNIHKKFGKIKIKSLPMIGTLDYIYFAIFKKIKWISFLDYFDYDKYKAMNSLNKFCNFNTYEGKHFESIFTRLYQSYILPSKFNIDKRKVHLSNLIISNQLRREEALENLNNDKYLESDLFFQDKKYFFKKINFSEKYLMEYFLENKIEHDFYKSELKFWNKCDRIYKKFKKI